MSKRTNARPVDAARWSLTVSRETDTALRTLLAARGTQKGAMSRFVEDAVNREVLREMISDIHAGNEGRKSDEIEQLIEIELQETRETFWSEPRN